MAAGTQLGGHEAKLHQLAFGFGWAACGGVFFVHALTTVTKRSSTAPFVLGQDPKGVLAGPGTLRDIKSDLFVTKWVAIQPFCTFEAGFDAEFRRESRQIGLTPSISTFF